MRRRVNKATVTVVLALACLGLAGDSQDRWAHVIDLLERYERGDHDAVVAEMTAVADAGAFARDLQRAAGAWIAAPRATPETIERRRLVAATLALELGEAHLDADWGHLRATLEWACALLRKGRAAPVERVWHLALVALAGGASDEPLLVYRPPPLSPDPVVRRRFLSYAHADHAARRFPGEIRFRFAEAVADGLPGLAEPKRDAAARIGNHERDAGEAAIRGLKKFADDSVVGPEAHLRIGHLYYCLANAAAADVHYQAALRGARDPFVRYLAHFFTGRMHEAAGRRDDAAAAYRQALDVQPRVQSGTMALAASLFLEQKPAEAYELVNAAFAVKPRPPDPWRLFGYGDYRFWPELIGLLRTHLKR
jgi:tetratricopeptide (TPR) repeat protein